VQLELKRSTLIAFCNYGALGLSLDVEDIFHFSVKQLAETHAPQGGAPLGVITVIESAIFETAEGQQALQRGGLVRAGANPTGHSIWCKRFTP
jgi:hypothetical protein